MDILELFHFQEASIAVKPFHSFLCSILAYNKHDSGMELLSHAGLLRIRKPSFPMGVNVLGGILEVVMVLFASI